MFACLLRSLTYLSEAKISVIDKSISTCLLCLSICPSRPGIVGGFLSNTKLNRAGLSTPLDRALVYWTELVQLSLVHNAGFLKEGFSRPHLQAGS